MASSLFAGYECGEFYDEVFEADGAVRSHYAPLGAPAGCPVARRVGAPGAAAG
ncbi:MAG: hypothetical protein ACRD0U_10270 [Acidimicrobiales bacterium]